MNDQLTANHQHVIKRVDAGIRLIQDLRSSLEVLRMANDLNKSFMIIDRQSRVALVRVR